MSLPVYKVMEAIEYNRSSDLEKIACKILDDYNENDTQLPVSIADIEKVTGICETLSNQKSKATANQAYALRQFVASCLGAYGEVDTEKDIINIFDTLRRD